MIQCILVNLGLKWFGFEITANALVSITRRCSGNECHGSLFMDLNELQKLRLLTNSSDHSPERLRPLLGILN